MLVKQGCKPEIGDVLVEEMADGNPQPNPFADSIYYCYDFGDDWTNSDTLDEKTGKRKMPIKLLKFKDCNGNSVPEDENERLNEVYLQAKPICIYADGLNVMDDVGVIYGYRDFLEAINEGDPSEVSENKEWAKWMGWTGRKTKPENVL